MSRLKVVALISGGKDSLFSILHCIANGHDVVATANLYPAPQDGREDVEDLESYMYQTIGHAVIPLYEQALGLPLFRQQILGNAVNQEKSYSVSSDRLDQTDQDETESLVPLLLKVQAAHPEVNAVSTGAILSDYQRTRVESVALRLGLIPLSYLWQWPSLPPCHPSSLLADMAAVGQDSRIVKVASGGLDDAFLWQDVANVRTITRLTNAAARFGTADQGAVLGEGGEYETLAVSGPSPLWRGKIVVDERHRDVVRGEAGSFSLRLRQPYVVLIDRAKRSSEAVRVPDLLEPKFEDIMKNLRTLGASSPLRPDGEFSDQRPPVDVRDHAQSNTDEYGYRLFLSRLTDQGSDAAEQTRAIMEQIARKLTDSRHEMSDIAYTSIIVRDMASFASINNIYGKYFTTPNPPARVTIACASVLPDGCHIMMAVTSIRARGHGLRQSLHVQSRSYWAPANIGPYSQAVSTSLSPDQDGDDDRFIYVAGQIPLVPASMDLPGVWADEPGINAFSFQTALALQHMSRIGVVMQVTRWTAAIAFVVLDESAQRNTMAGLIRSAWEAMHQTQSEAETEEEHEDDFDVWYASSQRGLPSTARVSSQQSPKKCQIPPLYIVEVDALPRGCSVEWAPYGIVEGGSRAALPELSHMQHLLDIFRDCIL